MIAQIGRLFDEARDTIAKLDNAVGAESNQIRAAAEAARATSQEVRGELQAEAKALVEASKEVVQRLHEAGASVGQRADSLRGAADEALKRSEELSKALETRSKDVGRAVERVEKNVAKVGEGFRSQARELIKASEQAIVQAQAMREREEVEQRGDFFRTATSMIEDLNSVAADLHRYLEDEPPDTLWKRYHKGDRSIFARRLARRSDDNSLPMIERRFETDERFRRQAERYIRDFESLLDQASNCDPENVLSTTFLTADVGKLYLLLARSLGRAAE